MGEMGVDAAVGQQAHQMQGGIPLKACVHGVVVGRIGKKVPVGDGLRDPGKVLEDHPAAADIGVAHLAVAHLPIGQAYIQPGGGQFRVGKLLKELIQPGGFSSVDCITRIGGAHAKAVHDNQGSRCLVHKNLSFRLACFPVP